MELRITLPADFITHEVMRFVLGEIVRGRDADPFGYSGEDAAEAARSALDAVGRIEGRTGPAEAL